MGLTACYRDSFSLVLPIVSLNITFIFHSCDPTKRVRTVDRSSTNPHTNTHTYIPLARSSTSDESFGPGPGPADSVLVQSYRSSALIVVNFISAMNLHT
jgi:hypothetical protein